MRKPIRITKMGLSGIVCAHRKRYVEKWREGIYSVTMCEFIRRARELKINEKDIQYVIWEMDYEGWLEALNRGSIEGLKEVAIDGQERDNQALNDNYLTLYSPKPKRKLFLDRLRR